MLPLNATDWPTWHDEPKENSGEVAPLRHDLALARYLERQQGWRASAVHRFDPGETAIRWCALVARVGRAGRFTSAVPSPRHDH
ncbi:hypothetical protein [Mesorhizobium sp. 113-3-3]|uniref:hypothetical protein n=1 Tax=Mesorhizobium sp. 113-3-3 TaxID=2744516 RepID=UPI001926DD95|nr:hypothetical protein [Mesorhizobium sp. 113-3-3]BCG79386.1 hypothetical protein MesoLj113b_29280 [Mesorhizobium sp. 113-3-3]